MKVEGVPEEGVVFGIQVPEEEVWIQLFLLLMKRLKQFFGLIRRIVNPCHENRKTQPNRRRTLRRQTPRTSIPGHLGQQPLT